MTGPEGGGAGMTKERLSRGTILAIVVSALGYFVDIYDLILFSVVRIKSLTGLGVVGDAQLKELGASLLNWQMFGILVGGLFWGVMGDRRGRISVLFGSIILYSLANIANGFVADVSSDGGLGFLHALGLGDSISQYRVLRFVAGVGLAGELGAGITLVSELMGRHSRGYGATVIASFGICGGLLAAFVSEHFEWRVAYWVGGGMGLLLLVLRIGVVESGLFNSVLTQEASRGNLLMLLWPPRRALKYVAIVLLAVPIWYVVGILITFAPEVSRELGVTAEGGSVKAGVAIIWCYAGLVLGDICSGLLSQWLRSRRLAIGVFLGIMVVAIAGCLIVTRQSPQAWVYYAGCAAMGFGSGYWAVFVLIAAEQFGTNLRATAATSAPCLVRGTVPIMSTAWLMLQAAGTNVILAAVIVGSVAVALAVGSLFLIDETFGKSLDFIEDHRA